MSEVTPLIMGEVGSFAHGLNIATSDHDYHAVYADKPTQLVGLAAKRGAFKARDRAEGVKSEPGDTEISYFGLREYINQVTKGNPTYHTLLFTPDLTWPDVIGLQKFRKNLLSRLIATTHVGYATSMYRRLTGDLAPRTNRPDLIAAHGYDTKAAYHAIRLLMQGHEILTTQNVEMPMRDDQRRFLMDMRHGEVPEAVALMSIGYWRSEIELAGATSRLPLRPDMDVVNDWLVRTHHEVWEQTPALTATI